MARPKLGNSESLRLQMVITAEELKAIDDWRYEKRVPSKSEAIRRLVQIGLRIERVMEDLHRLTELPVIDVNEMHQGWDKIVEEHGNHYPLSERYAPHLAILFSERFYGLYHKVFDAFDGFADYMRERNEIMTEASIPAAIANADRKRAELSEARLKREQLYNEIGDEKS